MDTSLILQYYATLNLVTLPVNALALLYLYKKTNLIDKFNDWLDRVLRLGDPIPAPPAPEKDAEEEPVEETFTDKEKYLQEKRGVSSLRIKVGDLYYCRLSSRFTSSKMYSLDWYSRNKFVGDVSEDGVFTAFHTGKANVGYQERGNSIDNGNEMYEIEVVPTDPQWFGDEYIQMLACRNKKDVVLSRILDRRILSENIVSHVVVFSGKKQYKTVTLQFNMFGELDKILFELNECDDTKDKKLSEQLLERFDEADIEAKDIKIWFNTITNSQRDDVQEYAFLRRTDDGRRLLGIGAMWREDADLEEFLENIQMAEKNFSDLMPGIEPAEVEAKIEVEPENQPAAVQPANNVPSNVNKPEQENKATPEETQLPENSGKEKPKENESSEAEDEANTEENPSSESPEENTGSSIPDDDDLPDTEGQNEEEEEEGEEDPVDGNTLDFDAEDTLRAIGDFNE